MHIEVDVHWGADGVLEGAITVEDSSPMPFHGVLQLLGLVETSLGPPSADLTSDDDES